MELRALEVGDVESLVRMHADDEWAFFARPGDAPSADELRSGVQAGIGSPDLLRWSIVEDGEVVGQVEVAFEAGDRIANLGYSVARPWWGRGLATVAARAAIDAAFTHWPDLEKVYAHIDPRNVASVHVAARCGMVTEGLLRGHRLRRGERTDRLMVGLLRREWERGPQLPAPVEVPYVRDVAERTFFPELGRTVSGPVRYAHGPDSRPRAGVPVGTLVEHLLDDSRAFPGTSRRCWVYVPAQYTGEEPASLLVVQDGWYYLDPDSEIRTAVVLDNLIHNGEIPVTIGVFVDPGEFAADDDPVTRRNRNLEYDTYSDAYAGFLLDEVLPTVLAGYRVADDPDRRAIAGGSSGGDCSFTVAWMRPDRFRKVLIFESSWPQVRDADYEQLIRETPAKPLRVFMQAATRDIGWWRSESNWFSSNLRVAAALAERGYDLRLVLGDGPHDPNHAGVILPDALRWLWRTEETPSAS